MEITRLTIFLISIMSISVLQRPAFAVKKGFYFYLGFLYISFLLLLGFLVYMILVLQSYVVYFGGHSHGPEPSSMELDRVTESHYQFLGSLLGSEEKAKDAIFYSYRRHINGFAANLEEEEAVEISKHPEVISVFINKRKRLHTTRSWDFLGLEKNGKIPTKSIWKKARFGEDTIIGNLDSGVWPESESFRDEGMGPVPSRWKGFCQNNTRVGVRCNRKLIGARYFNKDYEAKSVPVVGELFSTARDRNGHGTHTLSTAGGSFVSGASVFGLGNGTAKGGSPKARVAAYKVCWETSNDVGPECPDADIMAGFDAAIHDGVDVLSVSLGDNHPRDYLSDGVAIGSFHAVMNGIVVVCSAGNTGPEHGSVTNVAPWILTVGASTIDREFPSSVELANNMRIKGQSLSPNSLPEKKFYLLVSSVDAKAANASDHNARLCYAGSLDARKVKGKIVVCLQGTNPRVEKGKVVADAGGVGMILVNDIASGYEIIPDIHVLPTSHISAADGLSLFSYIDSIKSPMAYISPARTQLGTKPAPSVASFSSRGPNSITPEILKPDIIAPGVNVIAAFTQASGPSNLPFDSRRVPYNSFSGTSMSCPHVAGIVGLLRTLHPNWSPAAIKSAIMTTARIRDNTKQPILSSSHVKETPFGYGAGHVRPNRAMDPGLVYDLTVHDYLNFLCAVGYNSNQISKYAGKSYKCPESTNLLDFNYPSITVPGLNGSVTLIRTVKNVGSPGTYRVLVSEPAGVSVIVEPKSLKFGKTGEEKSFKVILKAEYGGGTENDYVFGKLVWSDGVHYVRSPIVMSTGQS
ncbi:hypothetical protein HHK36_015590 [Tetracentron sinense]|uniref:Subtilisin-like protease SBT5.3 n=1 Tax=Tetracentron sinense TaxID=13715 RepID=A0A834Z5F9_TETSI|nr:hypothetical protein HHK36_015590 [Tetracentron sinense]